MKISASLALATVLVAGASASTLTQTAAWPVTATDIAGATQSFLLFGSIGAPAGSVLSGVTIQISIKETLTSLSLTDTGVLSSNVMYTGSANFDAGDSANATDAMALDAGLANSFLQGDLPSQIYQSALTPVAAGATVNITAGLPATLTVTSNISGTTASYAGDGTFTLNYSTFSAFSISGFGGDRISPTPANQATALATVIYTYVPAATPEPVSMVLFGSGMLALPFIGAARFRRKYSDSSLPTRKE